MNEVRVQGSFRDPSGFLFRRNNILYRQVNQVYSDNYQLLISSGLYDNLVKRGLLIPHQEVGVSAQDSANAYKVIQPEMLDFISYPYEWSFSQLKDAALMTLDIQLRSLKHNVSLKDASAYNIQFHKGKPILVDTLSFEKYKEGEPWVAYKQFCQHFLAPLTLMAKVDVQLSQLLRIHIDGIPLDFTSLLLPFSTYFNFGLLTHIHLHAKAQSQYAGKKIDNSTNEKRLGRVSKNSLIGLIENLKKTLLSLEWKPAGTNWADYYTFTNYSDEAFEKKKKIVDKWLTRVNPKSVWDIGANNGLFTRLASNHSIPSISFDIDPAAVEKNYRQVKLNKEENILPLLQDMTNPSPSLGWNIQERDSLLDRASADMVFALALIHHLAISNNVPLNKIADLFHLLGKWLVIEFVPKSDSQVQKLLVARLDIFDEYTAEGFENSFQEKFIIHDKSIVEGSERILYLMERK